MERQTLPRRTAVAFDRHGRAGVAREHETQPHGRRTHKQLGKNESEVASSENICWVNESPSTWAPGGLYRELNY